MALDIEIDAEFMPVYEFDEKPVMRQNGLKFHLITGMDNREGHGHAILTTKRLILVNRGNGPWRSFSLPYMHTEAEVFDLGPAGNPRVCGLCHPHMGLLPVDTEYKIHFERGGSVHFQRVYERLLRRCREQWEMDRVYGEFMGEEFRAEWGGYGENGEVVILVWDQPMNPVARDEAIIAEQQREMIQAENKPCCNIF